MMDLIEHKAIAEVYAAESATRLGKAMFQLAQTRLPHQMLFIAFLPIKFEPPLHGLGRSVQGNLR